MKHYLGNGYCLSNVSPGPQFFSLWIPTFLSFFLFYYNVYSIVPLIIGSSTPEFATCISPETFQPRGLFSPPPS